MQVGFANVAEVLGKFGANVIINEKGQGSEIHKAVRILYIFMYIKLNQIKDKGTISVKELYLWAFVEHNGNLLLNDLRSKYNV